MFCLLWRRILHDPPESFRLKEFGNRPVIKNILLRFLIASPPPYRESSVNLAGNLSLTRLRKTGRRKPYLTEWPVVAVYDGTSRPGIPPATPPPRPSCTVGGLWEGARKPGGPCAPSWPWCEYSRGGCGPLPGTAETLPERCPRCVTSVVRILGVSIFFFQCGRRLPQREETTKAGNFGFDSEFNKLNGPRAALQPNEELRAKVRSYWRAVAFGFSAQ